MSTRIFRDAKGYVFVESSADGKVIREETGLSRDLVLRGVRPPGWGVRGEREALDEADAWHASGWTDRMRRL